MGIRKTLLAFRKIVNGRKWEIAVQNTTSLSRENGHLTLKRVLERSESHNYLGV